MMYPFMIFISLLLFVVSSAAKTLYSDSDPLWQLNTTNFDNTVLKKNHAWIIEFYSSWCGHCIRFAPTWKQFAQEIRTWKNIIEIGAVNCNDPENIHLCRRYEVASFPTIKMFWLNVNETSLGKALEGKRDIENMENKVINFLESHWDEGVPDNWPDIRPVSTKSLTDLTSAMPETRQSMMLYIEPPDVYTGRKVILDLSWQKDVIMKRILTVNERLMKDLNFKVAIDTVPSVIRIFRNNFQLPLYKFTLNDTSNFVRDQVFQLVIGTARNQTKIEDFLPARKTTTTLSPPNKDAVYLTDIENAVFYLLSQEIGVAKTIEEEKLSVVKSFLHILKTYFPGPPPVMAYLSKLYSWVMQKKHSISGEEFVQTMEQLQGENEYLPKMQEWIGCKGSEPQYRGYPCSLWTLFHTLTVAADIGTESQGSTEKGKVLFGIRDYVKNFFSCAECSGHFSEMAANVENEVNSTRDAVLWLWAAHNKVNHRLSGDLTEDPKHPKIQFPSIVACPTCQAKDETSGDILWDQDAVLKYLHQFYGRQNIVGADHHKAQVPLSADETPTINSSVMVNNFNVSFNEKWNFQWFTNTDISLCLSLYLVSALLLVIIFYLFRQRRRRRKSQMGKFNPSYA